MIQSEGGYGWLELGAGRGGPETAIGRFLAEVPDLLEQSLTGRGVPEDADRGRRVRRQSRIGSHRRDQGLTQENLDELRAEMASADDAEGYARELADYNPEDDTAIADVAEVWLAHHDDLARPIAEIVIGRLRANIRLFPLQEALALSDESLSDAEFVVRARAGLAEHRFLPAQIVDEALRRARRGYRHSRRHGRVSRRSLAPWGAPPTRLRPGCGPAEVRAGSTGERHELPGGPVDKSRRSPWDIGTGRRRCSPSGCRSGLS